ncbi:hypothetical protein [Arenimonas sp.]|uniref:hypothetical protein n=1 Tax=Arenimonas sp. TaxID=1872635 RepID=UPI0039E63834
MNTREPTTEPLDDDEREFARVVRALPAGEPPAALDARILKAASDAVASRPRRRFAWLAGGSAAWGIGTAAAAVLAIGVAWRTMNPMPSSLPPSSPVTVRDMEEQESTAVEFSEQNATDALAAAPPPPPPPADLPQAQLRAPPPPAMAPPAPPAPAAPMAFPETGLDEHVAHAAEADAEVQPVGGGVINAIDVSSAESSTILTAEQIAKIEGTKRQRAESARDTAAAKAAGAAQPAPASNAALGAAATQRTDASKEEVERRVQSDTRRYPESWLLKIRARLKEGDTAGARASLKLFVAKYPKHQVPDDLKPLLHP